MPNQQQPPSDPLGQLKQGQEVFLDVLTNVTPDK